MPPLTRATLFDVPSEMSNVIHLCILHIISQHMI